eukprot:3379355-Prymnesium_polylepis.1
MKSGTGTQNRLPCARAVRLPSCRPVAIQPLIFVWSLELGSRRYGTRPYRSRLDTRLRSRIAYISRKSRQRAAGAAVTR